MRAEQRIVNSTSKCQIIEGRILRYLLKSYVHLLWFLTKYRVILSALDPRKCEYLKDYSLDLEHAYMTTILAS